MRVAPELDDRAKDLAEHLGISKNQLIENAIWTYVLDKERFARCPDCDTPIFDKEYMPILEGVQKVECRQGHENTYDFEKDTFLFPAKK